MRRESHSTLPTRMVVLTLKQPCVNGVPKSAQDTKVPRTSCHSPGLGRTNKEFDMGKRIPLATRFWRKVAESGDCWLWTGAIDKGKGYGRVQVDGSAKYAHRVAYELMVGEIPEGLHLDHLCRNRACVNPYHLDPVTSGENTRRSPLTHGKETHCPAGHAYEGDNLAIHAGRRHCRTCNIERCRAFREARQAA